MNWRSIIEQSKYLSGADYHGEKLPSHPWPRRKGTWLQRRLAELKVKDQEEEETNENR